MSPNVLRTWLARMSISTVQPFLWVALGFVAFLQVCHIVAMLLVALVEVLFRLVIGVGVANFQVRVLRARNTIMVRRGLSLLGCHPSLLLLLRTHRRLPPSSTRRSCMQNPGRCGPPTPMSSGMCLRGSTDRYAWMTCAPSVPSLDGCVAASASSRWCPTSGSATNRPQGCSHLIEGLWTWPKPPMAAPTSPGQRPTGTPSLSWTCSGDGVCRFGSTISRHTPAQL